MLKLSLFGTSGCHLCEQAKAMLLSSLNQLESSTYQFCEIDIALDDQLVALYGVHIPVLLVESFSDLNQSVTRRELYWPFTVEDVFASVLL